MEAIRKIRRSYFKALVGVAPELKSVIPPPGSLSPPGGFQGKGKKGRTEAGDGDRPHPEKKISPAPPGNGKL